MVLRDHRRVRHWALGAIVAVLPLLGTGAVGAAQDAGVAATPGGADTALPVTINPGGCAAPGTEPAFTVGDAVAPGEDAADDALAGVTPVLVAEATIAARLDDLLLVGRPHAVVVRQSPVDIADPIACGDVRGSIVGGQLVVGLRPVGDSGVAGVAVLNSDETGILGLGEQEVRVSVYLLSGLGVGAAPAATPATPAALPTMAPAPATPAPAATPAGAGSATAVSLELVDFAFQPNAFSIPANTPVTVTLRNGGQAPHNFSIDALRISQDVAPGATGEVTIDAPAGTYQFYCNKPGHRELGMVGTLTVG